MIFQKNDDAADYILESEDAAPADSGEFSDDVETVVGPSVNVQGDLTSAGNIVVKGTVTGSVSTSKLLTVEKGAKIIADVQAGQAVVAGEIKGNLKIQDSLELTSTSRILGDITVKTLSVEAGALIYGKISMPGMEDGERKAVRQPRRGRRAAVPNNKEEAAPAE